MDIYGHHNLVIAARTVYSQNGFAVISCDPDECGVIDFFVTPNNSREKIAIRCLATQEDEVVCDSVLAETRNSIPSNQRVHIISSGKYSQKGKAMAAKHKLTLISGDQIRNTFSNIPASVEKIGAKKLSLLDRIPNRAALLTNAKSISKTSLFVMLRVLIVVAIGTVIYGGAPLIQNSGGKVENIKAQLIAKRLVSIARSAEKAGLNFTEMGDGEKMLTIQLISVGGIVDDPLSPQKGRIFGGHNLSEKEIQLASRYLEMKNGALVFNPELNDPASSVPEYHFAQIHEGVDPETISRRDAAALANAMKKARLEGVDYLQLSGGEPETAVRLMVERLRMTTAGSHPELRDNFDQVCDPDSKRLDWASQHLMVVADDLVYKKGAFGFGEIWKSFSAKIF